LLPQQIVPLLIVSTQYELGGQQLFAPGFSQQIGYSFGQQGYAVSLQATKLPGAHVLFFMYGKAQITIRGHRAG
jgi:hypothetical protein